MAEVEIHRVESAQLGWDYVVAVRFRGVYAPMAACESPERAEIVGRALRAYVDQIGPEAMFNEWLAAHAAEYDRAKERP